MVDYFSIIDIHTYKLMNGKYQCENINEIWSTWYNIICKEATLTNHAEC